MRSTLCVIATINSREVIEDQIDAIRWSFDGSVNFVIVDDSGKLELDVPVVRSKGNLHKPSVVGFKVNEGIAWALDQNIDFDMVMVLDDDALPIGTGLDSWAIEILNDRSVGLLGTKDDVKACSLYTEPHKVSEMMNVLKSWVEVPEGWEPPKENVFYAVNFQPRSLVEKLHDLNLLKYNREMWPYPCETFQAWITELLGYRQEYCGQYPNDLEPPLYSMHHGSVLPEDPRKISSEFLIHHSIRNVKGVDEWEIRKHFKMKRNPLLF